MAREIRAAAQPLRTPEQDINDYKDRLVKLIPSEIVTAYLTFQGIISAGGGDSKTVYTIIAVCLLLILTPFYLIKVSGVSKPGQIVFTTIAFVIWVMASGGFKVMFPTVPVFQNEILGSMLLIFYTLMIPLFYRG